MARPGFRARPKPTKAELKAKLKAGAAGVGLGERPGGASPADPAAKAQPLFEQALAAQEAGELSKAEALYARVFEALPQGRPRLWARFAQLRLAQGRLDDAHAAAARAVEGAEAEGGAKPFELHVLAASLRKLDRPAEAEASLRRALKINPKGAALWRSLGNAQTDQGRYKEAEASFCRALAAGDGVGGGAGLAKAVRLQGRTEEALGLARSAADAARAAGERSADAEVEAGMALLTLGSWKEGFPLYAARFAMGSIRYEPPPSPEWDGSPIGGKRLVVLPEQGLGDQIQFARLIPALAPRCGPEGRLTLVTRDALLPLLSTLPGAGATFDVVGERAPLPAHDLHAPLMSLPGLMGLEGPGDLPPVPGAGEGGAYLAADPERAQAWRGRLDVAGDPRLRVGLVWQGKPTSKADLGRSFPLAFPSRLARPAVRLVALQKEHGLDQLGRLPPGRPVETLGEGYDEGEGAFLDAAAVMANLDLVITSDTALAHLAGALGKEAWLVLQRHPDWRWGRGGPQEGERPPPGGAPEGQGQGTDASGERSPWYPNARLFRQEAPGDWAGAFAKVEAALDELLARRLPSPAAPVPWGELFDKISILAIKAERLDDPAKLANVRAELAALEAARDALPWRRAAALQEERRPAAPRGEGEGEPPLDELLAELKTVNERLWDVEDSIRDHEARGDFGPSFVELARSVYAHNDRRAAVKRALGLRVGSALLEEKSYKEY